MLKRLLLLAISLVFTAIPFSRVCLADLAPPQNCDVNPVACESPISEADSPTDIVTPRLSDTEIRQLTAEQMRTLDIELFYDFSQENFNTMPDEALAGMNANQLRALPSQIFAGMETEKLRMLPPDALAGMNDEDIQALPANIMPELSRAQFDALNSQALQGFDPDDMAMLNPEAINPEKIGYFRGDVIAAMTAEQLREIDAEEIAAMSAEVRAKIMANLDPNNPEQADFIGLFAIDDWRMSDGEPPAGTPMALPSINLPENKPNDLKIFRDTPNLQRGFGLGGSLGEDGRSVLDSMNELMVDLGLTLRQNDYGILDVALNGDPNIAAYAFIPEASGIRRADESTPAGIAINDNGEFELTLASGEQIPVTPALKDPAGVLNLDKNSEQNWSLELESNGRIGFWKDKTSRSYWNGLPSPAVLSNVDQEPGVYRQGTPGVDESMLVVYADGSAQAVAPALVSPQEFKSLALLVPGLTQVTENMDGTAILTFEIVEPDTTRDGRMLRRSRSSSVSVSSGLEVSSPCDVSSVTLIQTDASSGASVYLQADGTYLYVTSDEQCQVFYINPLSEQS